VNLLHIEGVFRSVVILDSDLQDTPETIAELAMNLREDDRLCVSGETQEQREPHLICSLGLIEKEK
jgi:hypothetical protein